MINFAVGLYAVESYSRLPWQRQAVSQYAVGTVLAMLQKQTYCKSECA